MSTFIIKTDYELNIREGRLDQLTQFNDDLLEKAEDKAIGLIKSYLNSRFDTAQIFSKSGDERNALILGYSVDLSVYFLWRLANPRKVPDYIKETKDDIILWLEGVNAGEIVPDGLPIPSDGSKDFLVYGSNPKRNNNP